MLYTVEAVVIRSMDYGEGDKIITLYTNEFGKVSVMVRGAKKVKSRHSASVQLFTYGLYTYYKRGQMGSLNYGEIIDSHHGLRVNLEMTAYAAYTVELVDRMLGELEGSLFLFEQLKAALFAIEEGKDVQVISHLFEMKILILSGYLPVLDQCVSCEGGGSILAFSSTLGGLLCATCRPKDAAAIIVSASTIKLLKLFQHMDMRRLGNIEVKVETKAELKRCMREFIDKHVGIQWKSRSFIDQMEKYDF